MAHMFCAENLSYKPKVEYIEKIEAAVKAVHASLEANIVTIQGQARCWIEAPASWGGNGTFNSYMADAGHTMMRMLRAVGASHGPRAGTQVEAGAGDDRDTGHVIEPSDADRKHRLADTKQHTLVAWRSGVRTWTPIEDLRW